MSNAVITSSIVLVVLLAGCHQPTENPDFPYILHIQTSFLQNESREEAMLPEGTPASSVVLSMTQRTPIDGPHDETQPVRWEHDPSCPYKDIGPTGSPGGYLCEDHPVRSEVRLPPIASDPDRPTVMAYPLPENGEITFKSHEAFSTLFLLSGGYTQELLDLRTHPDDSCTPLIRNHGYEDAQSVTARDLNTSVKIEFADSGKITLLWIGLCPPEDSNTQY